MRTSLYPHHVQAGAKMVDFAGWEMPLHYGSQVAEHEAVRTHAGCFDVSHMGVLDIRGSQAREFLSYLLVSDIERLHQPGQSFYTLILNAQAGIMDDLIVYRTEPGYRVIVNAATKSTDLAHMNRLISTRGVVVEISHRADLNIVAVQGPAAVKIVAQYFNSSELLDLARFNAVVIDGAFIARTGYTGEDGLELVLENSKAATFWNYLIQAKVEPCGLAARDSLRLEAGLNLNTQDMTPRTLPDEANLKWTVHVDGSERDFYGRTTLEQCRAEGIQQKLTGVVVEERGIVRQDCAVFTDVGVGTITSGLYSPTLGYSIGLARVPIAAEGHCTVEVRKRELQARLVRPPFVRNGVKVHK